MRSPRPPRRGATAALLTLVVTALVVIASAVTAGAVWSPASAGNGSSTATSVGLPTAAGATATSSSTTNVGWAAPAGPGPTPTQYVVKRTAPTTTTVCTVGGTTFVCQDAGLTPATTYTYTVEARVGSWSSGPTSGVQATTPLPPSFTVFPTSGTRTAGVAFNVTLTATTNGVTTDTAYTGAHAVTFSGPATSPFGTAPTYPATVTFTAGVGVASVTLVTAETATLTVTDGTRSGSAPVTVTAGASKQLRFSSSTPSCASGSVSVGLGGSFTSKVKVFDQYGNAVSQSAAISITLSRSPLSGTLTPTSLSVPMNASESSTSFIYTRPASGTTAVTVTAARSGLTSATCSARS
jgi:hypothetical protein